MNPPPCTRCGGPTKPRHQFPDTFLCRTAPKRLCGCWWDGGDGKTHFTATVTTDRGLLHFPHGPASYAAAGHHVLAIVRPKGGRPERECVYDARWIGANPASEMPDDLREAYLRRDRGAVERLGASWR